jgi:hypothetical protein
MQEINCNEIDVKKMRKHWAYQNRSLLAATLFDCSLRSKLKSDNTNPSSLQCEGKKVFDQTAGKVIKLT